MNKIQANSPCPYCGRYKNRVATVDAVVIKHDKVLLIKRTNEPFKDYWALPGGYMDFNENALEASVRELKEETGLSAEHIRFISVYSDPSRHPQQVVSVAYLIDKWQGQVKAGDDAGQAEWFTLSKLPSNLAFDHRRILGQAKKLYIKEHR